MRKAVLLVLIVVCTCSVFGQRAKKPNPYKFGVGASYYPSLEKPFAISAKFYVKSGHAMEFYAYDLENSFRFTALFIPYLPINRDGTLRLIVGPGVHVGFWKNDYQELHHSATNPIVGLDGIFGMEYRIPKLPLSIQTQYQPSADFAGNNEYFYNSDWAGFTLKVVF